ncbi:DUF4352 domain-containing protein [Luteococcus sp. OSA5]|uniref:DUF4352 domain-containing protein n=1 Tax=Luteococcus sp. OSA5 TaxID=3401630 RepID=UPI003B439DDF
MKPAALAIIPLLALTACSGGESAPAATVTVTQTVTAAPEEQPSESPSEELSENQELKLGEVEVFNVATMQAQQVKVQQIEYRDSPAYAALVKTCNTSKEALTVGWDGWSLHDAESQTFPADSSTMESDPKPVFPLIQELPAGKCVNGWMVFEVVKGFKPSELRFTTESGQAITWKLT